MRTNLIIYFIFIAAVVTGCSFLGRPLGGTYHNITAHYNAYFIAKERMLEIENTVYESYQWNYNKVLPIYVPLDSNDAKKLKTQIEDCVKKSSIAIQRHLNSRWEDDSYILVGKARYYSLEFADAIETFKYVNKHSDDNDARHEALIELIKTFIDFNEINNAIAVSDYLKKEELNRKNEKELHLVRAYLYQQRNDLDMMVQNLVKAEALMMRQKDRARIEFIIGQVYQQLGFEAEAYNFYESVLRNSPVYELEFYTKLNMAQVTRLTSSEDVKKTRKYFKKLLKDTKNKEYKDKIYYEMANFELKQGNLDEAIGFYKESIHTSVKNQRQKGYSYLKLGQIYYDSLKNFELAKSYYDSTIQVMPQDEEDFAKIKHRQEILSDFVTQLLTVRTNDSLIKLSQLPPDSVLALATSIAKAKADKEADRKKKQEQRAANARQTTSFDMEGGELIGTSMSAGATWYFYNPSVASKGISDFKRTWGERPLEDNWRRSQKTGGTINTSTETVKLEKSPEQEVEEGEAELKAEVEEMISKVPKSEQEIQKLLDEVEEALYKLGNIYNFKLEEKQNAVSTFESLLVRFQQTEYRPEVLYQLYLLYKRIDPELSAEKGNSLKEEFPESVYAKLVDNPNYREESHAATEQLKKVYAQAYALFKNGAYKESKSLLDSAIAAIPDNIFTDNLALLNALNMGEMDGQIKYQYELNNFIKSYPTSDVLDYAQKLLKASEDYQINMYNSAKARFIAFFNQKHYLVIVYPNKEELASQITTDVDQYLKEKNFGLSTGNLVLNEQNAMLLINEFPAKGSAAKFLEMLNSELSLKDLHKGEKIHSFVITEDNFNILYQTKDVDAYLNFFEKNYL